MPTIIPEHLDMDTSAEGHLERRSVENRRRRPNTSVPAYIIPAGARFAGRRSGGSNRRQVYGTRTYGSGYPGESGRGTSGRGFPFVFWPIAWTNTSSNGTDSDYLITSGTEYGNVTNSTEIRPGGSLKVSIIPSKSSAGGNFYLLADDYTLSFLVQSFASNCSTYLDEAYVKNPYESISVFSSTPLPEQVVQYYRASSLAVALDGYNNSGTYAPEGTPDSGLPSWTDSHLLDCLNQTIGNRAPLLSDAWADSVSRVDSISLPWIILLFILLKCL